MTIVLMLAETANMSRTNKPFVICKSCLAAFDVDLDDQVKKARGPFGLVRKNSFAEITRPFEARCVYCKKISTYSKGDRLGNTDFSSGDTKLAEMYYVENHVLQDKIRALENELKSKVAENKKLEKHCEKLANTIDRMQKGTEKPYRRDSKNPLSG